MAWWEKIKVPDKLQKARDVNKAKEIMERNAKILAREEAVDTAKKQAELREIIRQEENAPRKPMPEPSDKELFVGCRQLSVLDVAATLGIPTEHPIRLDASSMKTVMAAAGDRTVELYVVMKYGGRWTVRRPVKSIPAILKLAGRAA